MSDLKIDKFGPSLTLDGMFQKGVRIYSNVTKPKGEIFAYAYGVTREEVEENAKLIAAAPDLLAALIEIIKSINPQDVNSNKQFMGLNLGENYVGGASIPSNESIHKAINAIKKATE